MASAQSQEGPQRTGVAACGSTPPGPCSSREGTVEGAAQARLQVHGGGPWGAAKASKALLGWQKPTQPLSDKRQKATWHGEHTSAGEGDAAPTRPWWRALSPLGPRLTPRQVPEVASSGRVGEVEAKDGPGRLRDGQLARRGRVPQEEPVLGPQTLTVLRPFSTHPNTAPLSPRPRFSSLRCFLLFSNHHLLFAHNKHKAILTQFSREPRCGGGPSVALTRSPSRPPGALSCSPHLHRPPPPPWLQS